MFTMKLWGLVGLMCLPLMAQAHSDDYLDSRASTHGGQERMAGVWHLELVVDRQGAQRRERALVVHVTDHGGRPVATAGATGVATVMSGSDKLVIKLAPDGQNRLQGRGLFAATPELKAVVSVTLPGQKPVQARFTPLATPVKHAH